MKIINNLINNINFGGQKVNLLVYNDVHGSIKHVDSFISEQDDFYRQNSDGEAVNLTLCGGDLFIDTNPNNDILAREVAARTDAIACGNHDLEGGNYLSSLIERFNLKGKFHSVNIGYKKENLISDKIDKSSIIEKNGKKFGIIGVSPFDFGKLAFINEATDYIHIDSPEETFNSVKEEIKKLKEQGVNMIFLLAHTGEIGANGENYYEEFAKLGDIDVIIGGHDHLEVDKWTTSSLNQPVKIISTGRSKQREFGENMDVIGKLNLEFDDDGILIKENSTGVFTDLKSDDEQNTTGEVVATIDKPLKPKDFLQGQSEMGNLVADSNLWYVNQHTRGEKADFAFVNPGTIRGNFNNKNITTEDIQSVLPFTNSTLLKTTLTKKQIIDTLAWGALSTTFGKVSPGVMQVSGMEYTINPDLSISDVHILNDDGSIKYDLDDYSDDTCFKAVYDVFLATGVAGLKELTKNCNNNPDVELFGVSRQYVLKEYLRKSSDLADYQSVRIKKLKDLV